MSLEKTNEARDCWTSGKALEAGQIIYEQIAVKERPFWAARLLRHCYKLAPGIWAVEKVLETALKPSLWPTAREAFNATRTLTLKNQRTPAKSIFYGFVLYLAENTAKVTFNATELPAPYDHDAGW